VAIVNTELLAFPEMRTRLQCIACGENFYFHAESSPDAGQRLALLNRMDELATCEKFYGRRGVCAECGISDQQE
jgi:hypothetical protein